MILRLLLCVTLLLSPLRAHADEATGLARARFSAAKSAYAVGHYEEALEAFTAAYRSKPLPDLLFDIAQCHRQLGNTADAASFYRRFLETDPNAPRAALARELLAEVYAKSARAAIVVPPPLPEPAFTLVPPPLVVRSDGPRVEHSGLLTSGWFWGGVALAVTAVAAGTAVALTARGSTPMPGSLGTVDLR